MLRNDVDCVTGTAVTVLLELWCNKADKEKKGDYSD